MVSTYYISVYFILK